MGGDICGLGDMVISWLNVADVAGNLVTLCKIIILL